jgi:hypothetical protein
MQTARAWSWGWLRFLACLAFLAHTGTARAHLTGTIVGAVSDGATGKPVGGALVVATSTALQGEQTAVTDVHGQFTLPLLPPGRYRLAVQRDGYRPAERTGLALRVDYTLRANLSLTPEAVELEAQVVRSGIAPAVNVGTAEEGTVISREYLATVPTTREYLGAVVVTPTAVPERYGFSLGGGTAVENNFILDGLRVTDPGYGYLGSNLLSNFVDQVDVKVGGLLPEYGYTSAGVVNTVLRSGSNEFHGSIWGNLTPGIFSPPGPVLGRNGEAVATYSSPYKGSYDADFGLEVGGPVVKDRLWFYAGLASRLIYSARTGFYRSRVPSSTDPDVAAVDGNGLFVMQGIPGTEYEFGNAKSTIYAVGKLTWLVSEDHNLFLSMNAQPTKDSRIFDPNGAPASQYGIMSYDTTNVVLGYGGKFLDKHLLVEANLGWFESPFHPRAPDLNGVPGPVTPNILWATLQPAQNFIPSLAGSCPYQSRQDGGAAAPGCYVQNYTTGGFGLWEISTVTRLAGTASVTALFALAGQHVLKGGVQVDFAKYDGDRGFSGGAAYTAWGRYLGAGDPSTGGSFDAFQMYGYGQVDPASSIPQPSGPPIHANWCTSIVDGRCVNPGGKDTSQAAVSTVRSDNWSNGFYVQDSWTIANVLTLGFGVRLDTQAMSNASPGNPDWTPRIDVGDSWAPRVQAIWDFTGQGRGKVQASWGRYYESIPLSVAFYALASSPAIYGSYQLSSCTNAMLPGPSSQGNPAASCPNVYGLPAGAGPGPNTVALDPSPLTGSGFSATSAYYSPVAPGLQGQYTDQFGGGVQYEILQDLTLGIDYLGRRQGTVVEDMSSTEGAVLFLANPGVSKPWTPTSGPYAGVVMNPRNAASIDASTGSVYASAWQEPVRAYDAVTASLVKLFSKRWLAQASYTWSSLRGNYSGVIRTDLPTAYASPNQLSDYNLVSLTGNRTGPLGGNRTHQIKAAGSCFIPLDEHVSLTPGLQLSALSGMPVNAWGSHPLYGANEAYLLPRGSAGDLPWLVTLDLSARLAWVLSGPYTLSFTLSVFNVLDARAAVDVDQRYTFDFVSPVQGAQCSSRNAVSQKDPVAALAADCPDLAYARTVDGQRVTPNLNYGRATAYQVPVSARFGVALSF